MTLNQIADSFIHDFSGGVASKDTQLDRRDIIFKARRYLNTVMKPTYFEKKNEGDNSAISQAIYPYERSLEVDDTGQKFLTIPDGYMARHDNRGIHRVFVKSNPFHDFVIQHTPGISSNLPHTKLKNIQFCYIEGMKVMMGRGCTAKKADMLVLQIINLAPEAIGDGDALPMIPEQLAELNRLMKMDYAPFAQVPNDMANNQNTNIR